MRSPVSGWVENIRITFRPENGRVQPRARGRCATCRGSMQPRTAGASQLVGRSESWEQIAYVAITHAHEKTGMARGIYQRVAESRAQQDNEQWHLLILQEMFDNAGIDGKTIKFY